MGSSPGTVHAGHCSARCTVARRSCGRGRQKPLTSKVSPSRRLTPATETQYAMLAHAHRRMGCAESAHTVRRPTSAVASVTANMGKKGLSTSGGCSRSNTCSAPPLRARSASKTASASTQRSRHIEVLPQTRKCSMGRGAMAIE